MNEFIGHFVELWLDAAIWLIFGLIVAGIMHTLLPATNLSKHLKGNSFSASLKATLIGIPLPLCSCSVLPAALELRKNGASKSSTTSFLISTPETGVDSIIVSYALLGPVMTVLRPIAAAVTALSAALLVRIFDHAPDIIEMPPQSHCGCSCSCSSKTSNEPKPTPSLTSRLLEGQRYAFTTLMSDISLWLVIGLLLSASIMTFADVEQMSNLFSGFGSMLLMVVIGIPMYVCATASTPLALGMLLAGVSPGAVLVFLLAGPATNIATLGVIGKSLGRTTLYCYLAAVVTISLLFGLATNALFTAQHIDVSTQLSQVDNLFPTSLVWLCAFMLLVFVIRDLWKELRTKIIVR